MVSTYKKIPLFSFLIFNTIIAVFCDKTISAGTNPYRLENILGIKDIRTEKAIPKLGRILATSDNIQKYAAAQALFSIGTRDAHKILKKYLLSKNYNINDSITYALHWRMEQSQKEMHL